MSSIPAEFQGSVAFQLAITQGWEYRTASPPNIELEKCVYCGKTNFHFRMEIHGSQDENKQRDGLHSCMVCGKGGNISHPSSGQAQARQPGDGEHVELRRQQAGKPRLKICQTADALHEALLADEEALDYLPKW